MAELADRLRAAEARAEAAEARATAAEATDVLTRLKGDGHRSMGQPMSITGVTLHKHPGGALQPMPPGAAAADKVWYKQTLQPRGEVLGARRRMLVNARHSWVGDSCLARGDAEPPRAAAGPAGEATSPQWSSTAGPGESPI